MLKIREMKMEGWKGKKKRKWSRWGRVVEEGLLRKWRELE